jgi:glutamate-1-semialdehyde 2,1-aminomutase
LRLLKRLFPYEKLNKQAAAWASTLRALARKAGVPVQVNQVTSLFTVFFTEEPVTSYLSAMQSDTRRYARFFHTLLDEGVYTPPSQFEAAFLSTAHTPALLARAKAAYEKAFEAVR